MLSLTTSPFSTVKSNVVTVSYPSGAVFSTRVYVPSFRPVNLALLPGNVTSLSSAVRAVSASFTTTPSKSVSFAVSVNSALPASSGISFAPSAFLSITTTDFASLTVILSPSTATSPSVSTFTLSFTTCPSFTSKVNVVTVVYPSGAAVSSNEYLPSLRPLNTALLPSNST